MKIHAPERLRKISSEGGARSQQSPAGTRWTREEAKAYAKAGGKARWAKARQAKQAQKQKGKGS